MMAEKGTISINAENIMPVIKKWLYSDKDIFVRELVSNGCDAVRKYQRLVQLGDAQEDGPYRVDVVLNEAEGTIQFKDNGIGMTAEEVKKYFGNKVFKTVIPRNVRLSEAPSHGMPVIAYDRFSRGAAAYNAVAEEFLKRGGN